MSNRSYEVVDTMDGYDETRRLINNLHRALMGSNPEMGGDVAYLQKWIKQLKDLHPPIEELEEIS